MDRNKLAKTLHAALLNHDGRTLVPDWPRDRQDLLTEALDTFRPKFRHGCPDGMLEPVEKNSGQATGVIELRLDPALEGSVEALTHGVAKLNSDLDSLIHRFGAFFKLVERPLDSRQIVPVVQGNEPDTDDLEPVTLQPHTLSEPIRGMAGEQRLTGGSGLDGES